MRLPSALFLLMSGVAAVCYAQETTRMALPQEAAINLPAQPVGASDLLVVNIYNQPALSRTVRVSTDGFVRLPMLKQRLSVAGLLPGDLENAIAAAYQAEGILVDPQVTVNIAEYHSHPIQVGGSVRKPLTFQAEGPISLLEAINRAEGLTDTAGSEILVTKSQIGADGTKKTSMTRRIAVKALFESGDESANLVLTGGEEVRVPEAGHVFVVGNVKKPCQFPIKQGEASVLQALAYSEGLLRYSTKQAYIYRREGNGQKNEIPIELRKIMRRQVPDVQLLADDILYIPENENKRMSMTALASILTVGGGAAAYALVVYH
jgi:polysaccharide export outer membrane protein